MNVRTLIIAGAAAAAISVSATAAVSPNLAAFGKGPAQYLMTPDELSAWSKISTDADAQAFIDLFWAKRDPSPGTARNEFHEDFDRLVSTADQTFSSSKVKGSMTDRGRVLILLGPPARIKNEKAASRDNSSEETGVGAMSNAEPSRSTFIYEKEATPSYAGGDFNVLFVDPTSTGDYHLQPNAGKFKVKDLLDKAKANAIRQPALTLADLQKKAPSRVETVTIPAPVIKTAPAAATAFKTAAYGTAVTSFKSAATSPYKGVYVTYGQFVTPAGEYFVPVQLYATKDSGIAADTKGTFFGQIEDESGKVVAVYEEPATLTASKGDLFYDHSLTLPSGKYVGYFGLADATGKILGVVRQPLNLTSIDKAAPGTSNLIISDNIYPLPKAQLATDPFAFGGLKVVPKGDRSFAKTDDIDYFVEIRNPGLDPATGKPRFQAAVMIEDEKGNKRKAPPMAVDVQQVKGVEGHYWIASGYGASDFTPGKYKMHLTLTDLVTKAHYDLEESFRVEK